MPFDMKKFIARFVEEAREHAGRINEGLVALEKKPDDSETIHAIFRSAHTIKGSSRMLKLAAITDLAHRLEDALGALRDGKIGCSRELMDLLFRAIDAISGMVETVAGGGEATPEGSGLRDLLAMACEGRLQAQAPQGVRAEAAPGAPASPPPAAPAGDGRGPAPKQTRPRAAETVRIDAEKLDDLIKLIGEMVSNHNRLKQRIHDVREAERYAESFLASIGRLGQRGCAPRLDELLERAQALYGQIRQLSAAMRDDNNIQELLIGELQEKALVMRMVPLSVVFEPLRRTTRDIARSLDKDVDLVIEGGEIELDKKMMEKIGDALVHIIRNAVDHGIEDPGQRAASGKPATGTVKLTACYDAGTVIMEISDDGGGIPLDKIREKALRKKMFAEEELNAMDEAALVDLIFQPGFSTNAIITDISGRGVGMDVVRRNIVEDLRGAVSVKTTAGAGTVISIRLPLTLAIMPILRVTVSGATFAIAAHYVREIVRLPRREFIRVVDRTAIRLRNEFIPVADLASVLGMPPSKTDPLPDQEKEPLIVIVYAGAAHLGLIVDSLIDEEDMVIKSLPSHMRNIKLVSGVTISGRNHVINILHVPAIFSAAQEAKERMARTEKAGDGHGTVNILVVDDSINTREIEKSILESYGYRVTLAEDGRDGLEKAKECTFDAVITDVEMPRLDGFSLTELLRADEAYRFTPIIIVTSREKEEDKRRGIQVGADAYIVKGSFDQANLLETVQNLIG